jgi:hypothetical protein
MTDNIYESVINHANKNINTTGAHLFNLLDKISFKIYELSERNNIHNFEYIKRLQSYIDYIIYMYANKNNLL